MQNQNIWPIPNDDEWPLATVFDVTANQYFITIMMTSPPNIYFNMDECHQTKKIHSTSITSQHVHNIPRTALIPTVHIKTIIICNV